jgi:DNA-binding NarL/FixJ family response regulator
MLEVLDACSMPFQNTKEHCPKTLLFIMSEVRLLREGVAGVVADHREILVGGLCETVDEATSALCRHPNATVLLDGSFPGGFDTVRALQAAAPSACVVVFAVSETEENVVAWARAGAVGYIPASAALHELAGFIESVSRGEQICSAAIASRLIRRLRATPTSPDIRSPAKVVSSLTAREQEIIRMLAEGLSNKEIARALDIELSTTKTHVHNLLRKLDLKRRGQIASWSHKQGRGE